MLDLDTMMEHPNGLKALTWICNTPPVLPTPGEKMKPTDIQLEPTLNHVLVFIRGDSYYVGGNRYYVGFDSLTPPVIPVPEFDHQADPDGFWPPRICPYPRTSRGAIYTRTMKPTGGEYWTPTLTPPVIPPWSRVYGKDR